MMCYEMTKLLITPKDLSAKNSFHIVIRHCCHCIALFIINIHVFNATGAYVVISVILG